MKNTYLLIVKKNLKNMVFSIFAFSIIFLLLLYSINYFFKKESISSGGTNIIKKNKQGKLAIIIDDFGQNRDGVEEMMSIKEPLTFAVMPFMTFSKSDAEIAHQKGYEVIVHLPLEATSGPLSWVGPRPILTSMNKEEILKVVSDAFADIPYAAGANIHMGSRAGGDEGTVSNILDFYKAKSLYFVDSRSCNEPIAKRIADKMGVICYERNVFLDGKKTKGYTLNQLDKAADIALERGKAIAIGHVGTEGGVSTAEAISEKLPMFKEKNVKLVFVSQLTK
jgi:polysaccharide deacetylase 2 family uncharacterized protein YibQ